MDFVKSIKLNQYYQLLEILIDVMPEVNDLENEKNKEKLAQPIIKIFEDNGLTLKEIEDVWNFKDVKDNLIEIVQIKKAEQEIKRKELELKKEQELLNQRREEYQELKNQFRNDFNETIKEEQIKNDNLKNELNKDAIKLQQYEKFQQNIKNERFEEIDELSKKQNKTKILRQAGLLIKEEEEFKKSVKKGNFFNDDRNPEFDTFKNLNTGYEASLNHIIQFFEPADINISQ